LTSNFNRLKIVIMVRTQIQIPDPLYHEIKRVAQDQQWSIAEVVRRGAEEVVRRYPASKSANGAKRGFPPPLQNRLRIEDPDELKAALREIEEPRLG
tara:strand:+ start:374 stop:664 length:291 start_codon:yes stop_codon:yes gene_type:complete